MHAANSKQKIIITFKKEKQDHTSTSLTCMKLTHKFTLKKSRCIIVSHTETRNEANENKGEEHNLRYESLFAFRESESDPIGREYPKRSESEKRRKRGQRIQVKTKRGTAKRAS